MYLCGEPICHRVSCALLVVACKLGLIISTTGRALFRPREDFRRVGKKFTGGMAQTLVLFNISLVHFTTLLATKIVTSCSKLTTRAMSRSNIRGEHFNSDEKGKILIPHIKAMDSLHSHPHRNFRCEGTT